MRPKRLVQLFAAFLSGIALTLLLVACPASDGVTRTPPPSGPQLRVVPTNADYGAVGVGSSATQSFTLTNPGSETLYGNAVVSDGPFEIIQGATFALARGESQTLLVNFTPNAAGQVSGAITLTGSGVAPAPGLSVDPSTLNLGEVLVGSSTSGSFTLRNTGNTTISGSVTLPSGPFALTSASAYTLAPGESRSISLTFTPSSVGDVSRTLSFSGAGSLTATVSGRGVSTPPAAPSLSVTPTSVAFGNVETGASSEASLTVRNTGGGTLTGTATVSGSGFSITSGSSYSVAGGSSHTVVVRFTPTSVANASGSVNLTGAGGASVPLSGNGVTPVPPAIGVTPSSQAFGDVIVGQSAERSFSVRNNGGGTLTGSASVSGSGYSVTSGGSYSLTAGQTQTVTVRFSPTATGAASGSVTFTGASGANASVTGNGIPEPEPAISVTPGSRDFGSVVVGQSAERTFTVSNSGGKTLTGNATVSGGGFSVVSGGSYSLSAQQSQTVTVRFSPSATGSASGTVNFTGGGGTSAGVSGSGTTPPTPVIAPTSSSCNASTAVGASCSVTVSLSNHSGESGALQFTLTNPRFEVKNAAAAGITSGCTGVGAVGGIAVFCTSNFSGDGVVAVVTVERLTSGTSTFVTSGGLLSTGSTETAATGGSLGVP